MPADWQTSQTFGQLLLRLADTAGQANYSGTSIALPDDPLLLERLKTRFNDGWERFLRHRAKWTFMEMPYELTTTADGSGAYNVEGDAARYALPDYLLGARPKGNWHYTDTSALFEKVIDTSWEIVRQAYARGGSDQGVPQLAACRRGENKLDPVDNAPRWEVIFWPKPGAVYTLTAMFAIQRRRLIELDEKHQAGSVHDQTISACAEFEWYRDDSSDRKSEAAAIMVEALERSVLIDLQNEPKNLGKIRDTGLSSLLETGRVRRFDRAGVDTHNGVSVL